MIKKLACLIYKTEHVTYFTKQYQVAVASVYDSPYFSLRWHAKQEIFLFVAVWRKPSNDN